MQYISIGITNVQLRSNYTSMVSIAFRGFDMQLHQTNTWRLFDLTLAFIVRFCVHAGKKSTSTFAHIIGATHVFLPLRNLESLSPNAIPYTVNWTNNVSGNCCLLFKWIAKKKYFESSTKIDELFLVIVTQIESFVLKKCRESDAYRTFFLSWPIYFWRRTYYFWHGIPGYKQNQ